MNTGRKLMLYIAVSLDGYIAREDGDITWLSVAEREGEDYGYNAFVKEVDTVIMGRKTYDKVLSLGIDFPHRGRKCYVLSKTRKGSDEYVEFFNGEVSELTEQIRKAPGLNIFCDGGAEVVHELMMRNLIDSFIISIIPVLLGGGISLFKNGRPEQKLNFIRSLSFPSGLVQLWYEKV
jgi:dihydrofolate reductase